MRVQYLSAPLVSRKSLAIKFARTFFGLARKKNSLYRGDLRERISAKRVGFGDTSASLMNNQLAAFGPYDMLRRLQGLVLVRIRAEVPGIAFPPHGPFIVFGDDVIPRRAGRFRSQRLISLRKGRQAFQKSEIEALESVRIS
jgi:hypothetical protein